jgi:hypothetical protein
MLWRGKEPASYLLTLNVVPMFDPNAILDAPRQLSRKRGTSRSARSFSRARRGSAWLGLIATVLSVCSASACGDRRIIFCNEGLPVDQGGCPGAGGTGAGAGGAAGTGGGSGGTTAGVGGSLAGFGGTAGAAGAAGVAGAAGASGAAGVPVDAGLPVDGGVDAAAPDAAAP